MMKNIAVELERDNQTEKVGYYSGLSIFFVCLINHVNVLN